MGIYENFDEQKQFACRVIADHARATAFAIADGILPGNQDRNYVLRKIMRRAIYHGREHLGFQGLFFHKVCDFVVGQMKDAYPELETQREFIGKMVRLEEERFGNTLPVGLGKLNSIVKGIIGNREELQFARENPNAETNAKLEPYPSVTEIAKLNDTWGLWIDLAYVVLSQNDVNLSGDKINVDGKTEIQIIKVSKLSEEEFNSLISESKQKLQQNSEIGKTKQSEKINPIYKSLERTSVRSNFQGYETTKVEDAKVLAIIKDDQKVEQLTTGEEGLIVLDETPFYAEAGGQVGDRGIISGQWSVVSDQKVETDHRPPTTDHFSKAIVIDTFAPIPGITFHKSKVKSGSIKVGDSVTATVDAAKRDAIRRNHTATHLVHAALKEVLGTHVKQAGSVVAPNYVRFDFTHYQAMSDVDIKEVEDLVNHYILQNEPVNTDLMAIEEAMRTGAVAMFGEKYGSEVRVLSVGNGVFSKELCGGTHVRATGDIGSFKIIADEAIASGVRRIRALTGFDAFRRFREDEVLIDKSLQFLKTQRDQLPSAIEKLQDELKKTRKEIEELKLKIATGAIGSVSANGDEAKEVNGVKVLAKIVDDLDKSGMRHLSDTLLSKIKSGVVILGREEDGKVSFIVRVSDDLTDKVKAGKIVQEIAPIVGGRGGGKPDMAEGGGTEPDKLSEALDASFGVIEKMLE